MGESGDECEVRREVVRIRKRQVKPINDTLFRVIKVYMYVEGACDCPTAVLLHVFGY
jgi:hypothetical protein